MISFPLVTGCGATIRPPFATTANCVMPLSISLALCTPSEVHPQGRSHFQERIVHNLQKPPPAVTTRSPPTGDLRSTDLKLGQHVAAESHRSPVAHIKSVWSRPQSQPQ